jgi:hypothetical protein
VRARPRGNVEPSLGRNRVAWLIAGCGMLIAFLCSITLEWQAKLGDRPFHGYYSAILVREGNQAKIMEETVTIAAP